MTNTLLNEAMSLVKQLSPGERKSLVDYIDAIDYAPPDQAELAAPSLRAGTMDVEALLAAARQIRDGLSERELHDMIKDMNEEYVESTDDDVEGFGAK